MKHGWYLLLIFLLSGSGVHAQVFGQNTTCATAAPFCTGTLYNFPAGVNAPAAQTGPYYGCLLTRPNPAWYFLKIGNPGNIIISMHSEPPKDIDFCCWGPFSSQFCCDTLNQAHYVSCSYSPAATETCTIPNGLTGQYYMLIITNFSNQPCNIIFQQTGGTGTTDCSILPPPCANNGPVCTGQTIQLTAQTITGATYHWWGPASFNSTLQNPSIANATQANAGEYFLRIEVNGQTSSDTSTTIVEVYQPVANAGNDTTIMNGVATQLHGNCSGGSGAYHYKWGPPAYLVNDSVQNPPTKNLFTTTVFTVTVTDDSANCISNDMVTVNIAGGPLAVSAVATPSAICTGASTVLNAIGSGGAGNYNYSWTGPNGFTSSLPNPTVAPYTTSTYFVSANDGYNTVSSSVTVTVVPLPEAYAGPPQLIPNGFFTILEGAVVGGNSNYFYAWSPAEKLTNQGISNPTTIKLYSTTVYSLVVTDLQSNCVSKNSANVTISVTDGVLSVNPSSVPSSICRGDSTQLFASAGGGNVGHYDYTWTSMPPGFNSTEPNPFVHPVENTTYFVHVWDQGNGVDGSTTVSIYTEPYIHLGPADTTVCIYDTVMLDAGNPGSTYLWSNGSIERQILFETTGIGYDMQTYNVVVTNEHGCKSSGTINVIFTADGCVGIDDRNAGDHVRIYPNPATENVRVEVNGLNRPVKGSLLSAIGRKLKDFSMPEPVNGRTSADVELSDLPKGVYLVRLENEVFVFVQKLVVE